MIEFSDPDAPRLDSDVDFAAFFLNIPFDDSDEDEKEDMVGDREEVAEGASLVFTLRGVRGFLLGEGSSDTREASTFSEDIAEATSVSFSFSKVDISLDGLAETCTNLSPHFAQRRSVSE